MPILVKTKGTLSSYKTSHVYSGGSTVTQSTVIQYEDSKKWDISAFIMPDGDVEVRD